jgi:hypothetical protein
MHDPWTDQLSDYLDDELSAPERAALDAHLTTCEECRRTLEDLARIVDTARALTPRPPARDLWSGVARRLESSRPRRIAFTLPQLAAASLLLAAVTGGLVWGLRAPAAVSQRTPATTVAAGPEAATPGAGVRDRSDAPQPSPVAVSFADAQYDAAVADLEKALKNGRGRLDASTVAIVEQNLQVIDRAIAQARQALDADPANSYLSSHLVETRRRKLDLLRRAAELSTSSD